MKIKVMLLAIPFIIGTLTLKTFGQTSSSLQTYSASTLISLPVPQQYWGTLSYVDSNGVMQVKDVGKITLDPTLLPSFPNVVSSVTIYQVDASGSLTIFGNGVSAKGSVYEVIYDYSQSQSIEVDTSSHVFELVGISVRMVARVQTKSGGINLSSLTSLGIAASTNKVVGSLEVRVAGIGWNKLNASIPVTTDLSPASISNALQTVATIKSHIYDSGVVINPQILAFSSVGKTGLQQKVEEKNYTLKKPQKAN